MAIKPLPCPTVLRLFLRYEANTGRLFWRTRARVFFKTKSSWATWNGKYAGTEAFRQRTAGGRLQGIVLNMSMPAHRVAFAIARGKWPEGSVDHINRDPADNRICNLREASDSQNVANRGVRLAKASSEYKGVFRDKGRLRWRARAMALGKDYSLGTYASEIAAAKAYDAFALAMWGEFAVLNLPPEPLDSASSSITPAASAAARDRRR